MRLTWLFALLSSVVACGEGDLSNRYDRYLNVFGLHYAPPPVAQGAILGRVLLADGQAAAWSQVYARAETAASPKTATTNAKGGFYLPDLAPGDYQVFVVSPSGQGTHFPLTVAPDVVAEFPDIRLTALARVSGHARLKDEPVHAGIMVFAPGTPFSAFTDHEGAFFFDLPVGSYRFRAEKDNYIAYESDDTEVGGDIELAIELESNPWPAGRITVLSPDGFIVRGFKTKVKIEPVAGVKYMQFTGGSDLAKSGLDKWQPVKSEVSIEHTNVGYREYDVLFMDAYGKKSEPVRLNYYNTDLDSSWQILYGTIRRKVVIGRNAKVAFLSQNYSMPYPQPIGDSATLPESPDSGGSIVIPGPDDASDSTDATLDDDKSEPTFRLTARDTYAEEDGVMIKGTHATFLNEVTIEAGAQISGYATFVGDVLVQGTKAEPVKWEVRRDQTFGVVSFHGRTTLATFLHLSDGEAEFHVRDGARFAATDSTFDNIGFNVRNMTMVQDGGQAEFRIVRGNIKRSSFENICYKSASSDGSADTDSDVGTRVRTSAGRATFGIENSILDGSTIGLDCTNEGDFKAEYHIKGNNFLEPYENTHYLHSWHNSENGMSLPTDNQLVAFISGNHFRYESKLYRNVESEGWRFGANIATPLSGVGPR